MQFDKYIITDQVEDKSILSQRKIKQLQMSVIDMAEYIVSH